MSLENIKKEIEEKAAAIEKEILDEAAKQVNDIQQKAASDVKKLEEEAAHKLESEISLVRNRELSLANMEAQKKIFEARKHELAAVYEEAESKIKSMPASDREKAVSKMMDKAKDQIDVSVVYANSQDKAFVKDAEVKDWETDGCIICETKDGAVRVDYTFPTLFQQVKEKTMAEVSKKLFD